MSLNHILSTYLKSNLRQYIQFWLFSEIIISHHWILIILLNRIWNNSNISITPFIIPSQKSTFSSSFSLNIQNISMPFCSSISFSFNPKFIVLGFQNLNSFLSIPTHHFSLFAVNFLPNYWFLYFLVKPFINDISPETVSKNILSQNSNKA